MKELNLNEIKDVAGGGRCECIGGWKHSCVNRQCCFDVCCVEPPRRKGYLWEGNRYTCNKY